jgi:tetratricopeptide (TPR) repeat protein
MTIRKRYRFTIIVLAMIALVGCGYWGSYRENTAKYAGSTTFTAEAKPISLDLVELGRSNQNLEARKMLSEMEIRIDQSQSRNKPLMYADCGIYAIYFNNLDLAQRILDRAVGTMGSITIRGKQEAKAVSLLGSESDKVFKGEPHERAVVFLYRGLLYLATGDYENAQACFKSGSLQDALAKDIKDRADWLSLDYLLLFCKNQMKADDFDEWQSYVQNKYEKEELPPGWDRKLNKPVVLFITTGVGPEKIAGKSHKDELQYKEQESKIKKVSVILSESSEVILSKPADNCFIQAVTRGRRNMDEILAKKAGARKATEGVGSAAAFASPLVGGVGGLGLGLMKELSWSISDRIDSSADVRQMRMIPENIFLLIIDKDSITNQIKIKLLGENDRVIGEGALSVNEIQQAQPIILTNFPY